MDGGSLDQPVLASLTHSHSGLALRRGVAIRYQPEVSPFGALPSDADQEAWDDLAVLSGSGVVLHDGPKPPADWSVVAEFDVRQMAVVDPVVLEPVDVVELGPSDVADMAELVALTRPGPFERRTIELGRYVGVRDEGRLVAMAGERMRPPGWTEVSAVCTAPDRQGRGLARRLIGEVVRGILADGSRPFLHVVADNPAVALYESMGFVTRSTGVVTVLRRPR